jgi:23S rRNA (guanosine2251-2'-O)-methyltransferase
LRPQKEHREPRDTSNIIFGTRAVIEAITSGKEIDKVFVQDRLKNDLTNELRKLIVDHKIPYQFVPVEKLNRLTPKNHQGVVAYLSTITYYKVEDILPMVFEKGKVPLFVILDRITDVRNFGAIARSAECAGVDAIIIPSRGAAQVNGDAVKTSAGALHKIPVCREENLKLTLDYLKDSGVQIVACTEKTDSYYYDIDLNAPTAILMGSEEDGISGEYLKRSDHKAKIPLLGEIGSLNVSVAAGIMLYEAVRQRLKSPA